MTDMCSSRTSWGTRAILNLAVYSRLAPASAARVSIQWTSFLTNQWDISCESLRRYEDSASGPPLFNFVGVRPIRRYAGEAFARCSACEVIGEEFFGGLSDVGVVDEHSDDAPADLAELPRVLGESEANLPVGICRGILITTRALLPAPYYPRRAPGLAQPLRAGLRPAKRAAEVQRIGQPTPLSMLGEPPGCDADHL